METLSCPRCGTDMVNRSIDSSEGQVRQCPEGHGVFLERADLASLIEAEHDWHLHAGAHTAPIPRITADMQAAPPPSRPPARAWVETLFG